MKLHEDQSGQQSQVDQILATVLTLLWEAASTAPDKPWSLAKLSKRSGLLMSTLLRYLNALTSAGLVAVTTQEDGTGNVALTSTGRDLCAASFSVALADGTRAGK
ncbi:ArsR family transcriptional regulator [Undibacterium sp. Jales W-56]|uniref:ArsR family transcriptional regulator n=1 Tax=Undibacterium sp. Jales W-56 TaxID=2897325 RepID=UPI0021CE3143|nr:ArsR family transcriptional regulator [Undibacterium sp. Jales W-56]MCU6433357.1 ArsR family transcriptional regulator [Undibacterium sp. Jales W-56]